MKSKRTTSARRPPYVMPEPMSPAERWIAQKAARRYRNVLMAGLPKGSRVRVVDLDGEHTERVE